MTLQLAFTGKILFKNYDGKRSGIIELVKISSRAPIVDILCIKVWSRKMIFVTSISILTISLYLIKACFSITFHKSIVSKMKSRITFRYIIIYREVLKR